jgi:hypothetical protein
MQRGLTMSGNKDVSKPHVAEHDTHFSKEEMDILRELIRDQAEVREIVHSKLITKGIINFIGEAAKYIVGLIAVVIAYRNMWGK